MNERHKGQLKIAHQLYDNRDLKQELLYQREFLHTGYLSYQEVCFNKWIFDECLKRLEERKVGRWEKNEHTFWTCSECGLVNKYNRIQYAYCPNCGADMRGTENG